MGRSVAQKLIDDHLIEEAGSGSGSIALGILLGIDPMFGIAVAAVAVALLLVVLQRQRRLADDTLLGILAVVFFIMAFSPGGFGPQGLTAEGQQTEGLDARRVRPACWKSYDWNSSHS